LFNGLQKNCLSEEPLLYGIMFGVISTSYFEVINVRTFFVILLVLILTLGFPLTAFAIPDINGKAYILIDGKSGQVLCGNDINSKLYPASTTKILTTIIALEISNLKDEVTISKNVPLVEGTKVYLREGEKVTLEELLNAAMVHSANDAALAIAEHISGSQEKFAKLMNEKAKEIGAKNSNFVNPHGLTDEKHVSTAYDLALIAKYAMQNAKFRELAGKKYYDWNGEEWQTRLYNINEFLSKMEGSTGIKSGYTKDAKNTLVASAKRDNQELICVILGSKGGTIWDDAKELLSYGFNNFQSLSLTEGNEIVATIKMADGKEVHLTPSRSASIAVKNNEQANIERKLVLNEFNLPIDEGKVLGELVITVNEEEKDRIPVQALEKINKPIDWFQIVVNILAGVFLLQILVRLMRRFRKKKRRQMFGTSGRRVSSYRL